MGSTLHTFHPREKVSKTLFALSGMARKGNMFGKILVFAGILSGTAANAALIANWQFNSYTGGNLSNFAPDAGTQSGTAKANISSPTGGSLLQVAGTTLNETTVSSPNRALEFKNTGGNPNPYVLTFQISGTGLNSFVVTYAAQSDHNPTISWAWSTDGTTFTTVGTSPTLTATYVTYTADFSGVSAINNATSVYFRETLTDTGVSKLTDFDNFQINAVPEPINVALGVFGVCAIGIGIGRRLYFRTQA